jgi:uncharacterized protein
VEQHLTPADAIGRTRLLILQPTPFCNIDCDYCYLPTRSDRHRMPYEIIEAAIRFVFSHNLPAPDFTVVWHGGEPLVLPVAWYREAFRRASSAAPSGAVLPHAMQTNGILIDDEWCEFFQEIPIKVGISLDGPQWLHDLRRKTRSGGGTFSRVMRGLEKLRRNGVPFHVICVVTDATLDAAEELMDFFIMEGVQNIGFNLEEIEGVNTSSSLLHLGMEARYRSFFARVIARAGQANAPLVVREQQELLAMLQHPTFGRLSKNTSNDPFGFMTVSSRGAIFTFSPELAGLTDPTYGDLAVGQLPDDSLEDVFSRQSFQRMWADIEAGTKMCQASCSYFDLCLGGAPSNKLAENGSFATAETTYCRLRHQALADVILTNLEHGLARHCRAPADAL